MAVGSHALCILVLVMRFTSCRNVGMSNVPYGAGFPLASSSNTPDTQVVPFLHDAITQSTSVFPDARSSSVFLLHPEGNELPASSIKLLMNVDGSVSVHTNGRSVSLLHGLEPSLVTPALLPFLFPFCDVPPVPVGVAR